MKKLPPVFVTLALLLLIVSCGEAVPTAVPAAPTVTSVSATAVPSPTAVPQVTAAPSPLPTLTDSDTVSTITVPRGNAATIDGTFSSGEWDNALAVELAAGELLLMHDGAYLYAGIRSDNLGLGSVCVIWDDEISILHSSAALGTATYKRADEGWQKTRDFTWTNRETGSSQQALEKRQEHLERENWLASNGRMGDLNEMEYQIAMTGDQVQLAVAYLLSPDYETTDFWPDTVGSGCRNFTPAPSGPPQTVNFAPESWITVIAAHGTAAAEPDSPSPPPAGTTTPALTPLLDGSSGVIAFTSERDGNMEVYIMATAGGDPQRLTNHPGEDYWPTWSPDGAQIAFASERDGDFEIYAINADGSNLRRLTHESGNDLEPDWSPAGDQIAFMVHQSGKSDIYIMNSDGGERQQLTDSDGDNYLPKWSPDGGQIIFVSGRDGNPEIYVMNADGSGQRRLTDNPTDDLYPSWSPDGAKITFYSQRDGSRELYVMDVNGRNPQPLTHDNSAVWVSSWSPDGRQIAFTSNRDGNREIYMMDIDGRNRQRLTNNNVLDGIPAWRPFPLHTE